jgi:hypothetical protein
MSNYRAADTKTQWFQNKFPGSDLHLTAETAVVVLHTTESSGWPDYAGGSVAPNYTARPNFQTKRLEWRAHFPDEKSARALQNDAGGVETNTLNAVQVELIGTCDPKHRFTWAGVGKAGVDYVFWPEAPGWALTAVAHFLVDQHKRHGLKFVAPTFLPFPASSGASKVRFSFNQWHTFAGVCGHQHVPENDHGDPGNIDIKRILQMAQSMITPNGLRVAEANLHHDRPDVEARLRVLRKTEADVIFTNEAYNIHTQVRAIFGDDYRIVQGSGGSKGHREVQLLLRKKVFKVLDKGMWQATEQVDGKGGLGNERWVCWAKVEWRGKRLLLVSWHGNAGIQSLKTGLPLLNLKRTQEYVKEIWALERFCRKAQDEGFEVVIGGDGNYRRRTGVKLWQFSPHSLHRRLGLTSVYHNVDIIGFPKSLDLAETTTRVAPGADHKFVVVDLELA